MSGHSAWQAVPNGFVAIRAGRCYAVKPTAARIAAAMVSTMLLTCQESWSRTRAAHGTFAGLMDLYERNYILVRRLIPTLPGDHSARVSRVAGGLDLHLSLVELHRYTTDFRLTYRFNRGDGDHLEPDLHIRVYHDARVAEVLAAHLRRSPAFRFKSDGPVDLNARWRVNRFLFKWLGYSLHQGHAFT